MEHSPLYDQDRDYAWIRDFQEGNEAGYEGIYKHYIKPVFYFVKRYTGCDDFQAEDVSQEIMVIIYEKLNTFQFKGKFSNYIYTIALNYMRNLGRRKQTVSLDAKLSDTSNGFDLLSLLEDTTTDIESDAVRKEIQSFIYNGLTILSDKEREVFILKEFEKLSFREISEITGETLRNQQLIKDKANKKLRDHLVKCGIQVKEGKAS